MRGRVGRGWGKRVGNAYGGKAGRREAAGRRRGGYCVGVWRNAGESRVWRWRGDARRTMERVGVVERVLHLLQWRVVGAVEGEKVAVAGWGRCMWVAWCAGASVGA